MTVQITIVGMGQIGASIGMALSEHKQLVQRVGHDREIGVARQAEKKGAIDKVAMNLPNAVKDADLVLLALPMDQIRETMEVIASELKAEAVVMDTSPVKEIVTTWAKELLPGGRYYVGLTPVLNPAYLQEHDSGVEAARPDLFQRGMVAIVAPQGTPSGAIKLAADLTHLLGAEHIFVDPVEIDSLMASTHILPQLLAATLLNVTVDQPGWLEGRKIAGRAFAEVTGPVTQLGEPAALASAAIHSRQNLVRVMDTAIAVLQAIRNDIQKESKDALVGRLEHASQGRYTWWHQRQKADWLSEGEKVKLASPSERMGQWLRFGGKPRE